MRFQRRLSFLTLSFLLLVIHFPTQAQQSKKELEAERNRINKQIQAKNQELQATKSNRATLIANTNNLKSQLQVKQDSITLLETQLDSLSAQIMNRQAAITELEVELFQYEEGYNIILRALYRHRVQRNPLWFIFSTQQWLEAYHRWYYLRYLENTLRQQLVVIKNKSDQLQQENQLFAQDKDWKARLLSQLTQKKNILDLDLESNTDKAEDLRKKEKELQQSIARKERAKRSLNSKIEDVIRSQMTASRTASRTYSNTQSSSSSSSSSTSSSSSAGNSNVDHSKLTSKFAAQKGKLKRPVKGSIVSRYGRQVHPEYEQVFVENNGIDFKTSTNASVVAVYEGEVVSVFAIPGSGSAVMIKHGDYFTIYSNLSKVTVKSGNSVKAGTGIGKTAKETQSGQYQLHFELWKGKSKVNPEPWLGK